MDWLPESKTQDEDANSLKLRLKDGEIDFIVAMSLLGLPAEHSGETGFALEPVAEVLAKKLFYRKRPPNPPSIA